MRETTQAHYLHERQGLEAVLRPPVPNPVALAWIPGREELLVATRDGSVHAVDPAFGTSQRATDVGEATVLAVHPDRKRFLVVSKGGKWVLGELGSTQVKVGQHPFRTATDGWFLKDYVVLCGDTDDDRRVLVLVNGEVQANIVVPPRSVPAVGEDGKLVLARSTDAGLKISPLSRNAKFPDEPTTAHRLTSSPTGYLGVTATGLCVWSRAGGQPVSMRFPDLSAGCLSKDGRRVGLGTRTGAVGLARLESLERRVRPDLVKAFDANVVAVAFADRGRWLATAAEQVQLWSWEEDEVI